MKIRNFFRNISNRYCFSLPKKEIDFSRREKIHLKFKDKRIPMVIYSDKETISTSIRKKKNFFELDFLIYLLRNFPEQRGIIDIGANIGNHSLFFTEFLKYDKIYCFEPFSSNAELLRENLKGKNSEIFEIALSDREGKFKLYNSEKANSGGFSLVPYENISYEVLPSIPVKTLDSFHLENISMIKIDVEANELNVLNGAVKTIIKNRPYLFIEDLHHGYPNLFDSNRFDRFFHEIGYLKKEENIAKSFMDLWIPRD